MSSFEASGPILRGNVERSYHLQAPIEDCYQYLSDIKLLLAQVPFVSKIQIGKTSRRARVFFDLTLFSFSVKAVLDLDPQLNPQEYTIRLKNAEQPLGPIPPEYMTCKMNCRIKMVPLESGFTRVTSRLQLAFDGGQLIERRLVSSFMLEMGGSFAFQQYCEKLADEYLANLTQDFQLWQLRQS